MTDVRFWLEQVKFSEHLQILILNIDAEVPLLKMRGICTKLEYLACLSDHSRICFISYSKRFNF
jgi:hypothetical protein